MRKRILAAAGVCVGLLVAVPAGAVSSPHATLWQGPVGTIKNDQVHVQMVQFPTPPGTNAVPVYCVVATDDQISTTGNDTVALSCDWNNYGNYSLGTGGK